MLQQSSANSFELAVYRLSSLPTHQFSRTLPTHDPADSAVCRLSSLADSAVCRLMLQQSFANSFELAVCRLTSSVGPCRLSSLLTQQPGRLSSLSTHVAAKFCQRT
ncbi:hypothetical protein Taro_014920 [Colocasia esculenta]|uniref:Uncharacterized protein n=1 Tax=Colocasia esculenta TaxID=4460 RepID=A0A843UGA9_COLES|nr:hypothetical protein [Colocasia esculenta]